MSDKAKRSRTHFNGFHHPVVDFWRREVGGISSRKFSDRFSASENLVQRLEIEQLVMHNIYVHSMSFNTQGDVLISSSTDRHIHLWDWQLGKVKLSFHSGHSFIVAQSKFMPFSDDRTIVTCGAVGMVRRANILESGEVETVLLGSHEGWAHKLCTEPGNPHIFYTCGDDGFVQRFDLRTQAPTKLFKCQFHDGGWNSVVKLRAMAMDPRNFNLLAVGGGDEYARLYDIRRLQGDCFSRPTDHFCPPHLIDNSKVRITGLAFSEQSELLVSYRDKFIYLFTHDMGLGSNHPTPVSKSNDDSKHSVPMVFKGQKHRSEEGLNFFGPRSDYVVSGTDRGQIFIWKKKSGELIRVMEGDNRHIVNCIEPHPHIPMLASTNKCSCDIKLWTSAERATLPDNNDMSLGCNGMDGGIDGSEEEDESIDGNEEDDESIDGNEEDDESIDDGSEEEDESIDGSEEEDESIDGSEEEDESIDGNEEDDDSDDEKLSPRLMRLRRNDVNDVFVDRMDLGIDGNEVEDESIDDAEDDDSDDSSGLDENDSDDEMDTDDSDDDECSIEIDNTRDTNGDGGSERNAADSVFKSCEDDGEDDSDDDD